MSVDRYRESSMSSAFARRAALGALFAAALALGCQSAGRDPDCPVLPADPSDEEIAEFRAEAEAKKCVTPLDGDFPAGLGGGGAGGEPGTGVAGGGASAEGP